MCCYTNWSQYSPWNGRFVPENVSPFLCTHVVYAFAKLSGNHLEAFEWTDKLDHFLKENRSSRGCIMCPVIGDGIKNTLTTVFLLLLLFINLWTSLLIINIWKCCFPGTSGSSTWRGSTPTWRPCLLSAAGTWHLLPSPRWWPLQRVVRTLLTSVTFLKSNSFEARKINLIVYQKRKKNRKQTFSSVL